MAFAVYVSIWRVWNVSSATMMASATDEFLSGLRDSLVAGCTIRRRATGRMISRYDWKVLSPMATHATNWVREIDWIPARKTSQERAPLQTQNARTAAPP